MLPPREREIPGRIVVVYFDVCREPGAGPGSLYQIVAEQRVLGEPAVRRFLECVDVVNPFSCEAALAV